MFDKSVISLEDIKESKFINFDIWKNFKDLIQSNWTSKTNKCPICNESINSSSKACRKHQKNKSHKPKIQWPSIDIILNELKTKSRESYAKELGVSGNALKKHIKKHINNVGGEIRTHAESCDSSG